MKKIFAILAVFAFIWGCEKVDTDEPVKEETPDKEVSDNVLSDFVLPEILYASISDEDGQKNDADQIEDKPQTRTVVGDDGKKVLWQTGDAISYFAYDIHNAKYVYKGEGEESNVELSKDNDKPGTTGTTLSRFLAVYPYNENTTVVYDDKAEVDIINLTYLTTQTYAADSFGKDANIMVAAEKDNGDDKLYFRNACGYLVIKLYGNTTVKNITLSAVDGVSKIAGKATIVTDENKIPVATMSDDASTSVTLDCSNNGGVVLSIDKNNPTEFWFALPPVNIKGGIKIVVTDMSGNIYTKQTTKDVNITRNNIQPMAALQFVSNIPASNKIWYTKVADAPIGMITFGNEPANPFDATIIDHYYDSSVGKYVIAFDRPVKTIKAKAFYSTAIQTIELPDGLETIEEGAFGYTQIPAITIPGSVNTIKTEAFSLCPQLESIEFLPSPTQTPLTIACIKRDLADYGPFENAYFKSIKLNRELVYVDPDGESFKADQVDEGILYNRNTNSSVSITIGGQVSTFPEYMLSGLKFTSLTIPGTVTVIGHNVFNECTSLTNLTFEPSPTGESLTIGANWGKFFTRGLFADCPLKAISLNRQIEYGIQAGDTGVFSEHSLEDGITLGEQVHTLLSNMFNNSGITSISIPATVMKIRDYAFSNCTELSSIRFEASAVPLTIGFQSASDLADQVGPFYQSPLTDIYVNRELVPSESYADKRDQNDEGIFSTSFDDAVVTVTLGENVKTISDYMFTGVKMESLTIPGSVTTIGNDVFNGCNKLASITFEPSPTDQALTIGWNTDGTDEGLFVNCPLQTVKLYRQLEYGMTSEEFDEDYVPFAGKSLGEGVTLGEQVHTLLPYMFYKSGITSLKIPATVEEIMDNAFYECTTLASVRFEAGTEPLTIGFQPGSNERGPFYQSPLTNIYVNRELVASESYAAARNQTDEGIFSTSFDDAVVTVTLQGNVNTISDYMFAGVQMETIWIPREVTTICKGAFYNCSRLYGMTLAHSGTYPRLIEDDTTSDGGGAFKWTLLNDPDLNNSERWIALEDGSDKNVKMFKGAPNWSYYYYIIQAQKK